MSDRIEIYRSGLRRRYRWRYVAANGNILADSGQGYSRRIDALNGAATVTGCRVVNGRSASTPLTFLAGLTHAGDYRSVEVTR